MRAEFCIFESNAPGLKANFYEPYVDKPSFDKCVETKLRWDVYIRPWPPGWSFWRRIYTSRGSERVKLLICRESPTHQLRHFVAGYSSFEAQADGALAVYTCLSLGFVPNLVLKLLLRKKIICVV